MTNQISNTHAGIYVRISRDSEDDGLGVARQRRDCSALAESIGWDVVEVFTDNDISASNGKTRPAYQRLAREVEAGRINGIICWDVDRLSRTPRELEDIIDWADKRGLSLASVGGEIDLATPQGRLTARLKGSVARHEVEQSSRRIRRKRQELAEQGRYVGARPFGWSFTPNKNLVINEAEAAVVREAVKRTLDGDTLKQITRDLNDRGITTVRGGAWVASNLRKILLRSSNVAILVHQGREVGPGDWPAIVSREDHDRVVSLLTDPRRRTNNRGTAEKYLLSGIVRCAECGQPMRGVGEYTYQSFRRRADGTKTPITKNDPRRYRCTEPGCFRVSRHMDELDAYVTERSLTLLEREGVQIFGGDSSAAETAHARVEALDAKLKLTADQFSNDLITGDQLQRITANVRPQLEAAQADLRRAQPPVDGIGAFTGLGAREAWSGATLEQQRQVLRLLLDAGLTISATKAARQGRKRAEFDPNTVSMEWSAS